MNADRAVAHVAFEFRLRGQGSDRIHHHKGHRARPDKGVGDLKRLLPGIGLRDQQFIQIHAKFFRILRIKRMFGVHKGTDAALFLFFCNAVKGQRGLARAFRPIDLDDPAFG